jgi:tetratricopeptide (TPR) repeat protein
MNPLSRLLRIPRTTLAMGVGVLLLAFTPGFDVLGHYSALAASLLISALVGPLAVTRTQEAREEGTSLIDLVRGVTGDALSLVLLGAGILTLNALRVKNCDLSMGVAFWALGPAVTALFCAVAGVFSATLTRTRGLGVTLYFAGILGSFSLLLAHFLTGPTVTAYSPFFGHLAGAVYDDVVPITGTWLAYRLNNGVQALLMAALMHWLVHPDTLRWKLARLRSQGPGPAVGVGLLLAGCLLFHLGRAQIGFERSHADVRSALDGRTVTPHFIVHHPREDDDLSREVPWIAYDLEYRYAALESALGVSPTKPIHVHLYGTAKRKRQLMGADKVSIAKPWLGEVHLGPTGFGDPLITHELAHVFAAEFAPGPLHVSASLRLIPHMALIEGLAKAVEGHRSRLDLHQWSAAMDALDILPDLDTLLGPGGYTTSHGPTAYTAAGSFLSHLLETRGAAPVRAVYGSRDFKAAFGAELSVLKDEWLTRLRDRERTPIADTDLEWARNRFDRKPILQRVCPLVVASRLREASVALKDGDATAALAALDEALAHRGGEPRIRLQRIRALAELQRWEEVATESEALMAHADSTLALTLAARERRGDAHWATGERAEAAHLYASVERETVGSSKLRRLAIKLALVRGSRTPVEEGLRTLLLQRGELEERLELLDELAVGAPDSPLLHYLRGRHLHALRRPAEVVPLLRAALQAGLTHPLLIRAAHRDLATSLWLLGQWDLAALHFQTARTLTPAEERGSWARLSDWIARCEWSKSRGAHALATPPPRGIGAEVTDGEWIAALDAECGTPSHGLQGMKEEGSSWLEPPPCAGDPPSGRRCCGG